MKVLVVRSDRIGDLVLALPALTWLHRVKPNWEIHALVAPQGVPLIEHDPAVAAFYTWDGLASAELAEQLAGERYDAAVMLNYQAELAWLLRRVGIKRRYGPLSKLSSWLLLNRGQLQRRSRMHHHECDYNLDLVRRLVGSAGAGVPVDHPRLHLSESQQDLGQCFRRDEGAGADILAFLHPGSGGSALDYPPIRFAQVANDLAQRPDWRVFLTGSHLDRPAIDAMAGHLDRQVGVLAERFPLRDFLGILAAGDLMIAPSTGPLHLAAALDLAAVGIYPPAPTLHPRRWGPLGRWAKTVLPPLDCPARRHCLQEGCMSYNCLGLVAPRAIVDQATALAATRSKDLAAVGSAS